jgi:hypothetical protein
MLWFLECSAYFIVDGIILLFVALIELLGLQILSFVIYEILVVCELLVGLDWARKCWSMMGMIGHASVGPLGA